MRVMICCYDRGRRVTESLAKIGLEHGWEGEMTNEELESLTHKVFHNLDLNVMLMHRKDREAVMFCVDTVGFTQR